MVYLGRKTRQSPFGCCGEYLDKETGERYLRARYYDSGSDRFTAEDPKRDGLNRYAYCGSEPVNNEDPSGLSWLSKAWSAVKTAVSRAVGAVSRAVTAVTRTVQKAAVAVTNAVRSAVSSVMRAVTSRAPAAAASGGSSEVSSGYSVGGNTSSVNDASGREPSASVVGTALTILNYADMAAGKLFQSAGALVASLYGSVGIGFGMKASGSAGLISIGGGANYDLFYAEIAPGGIARIGTRNDTSFAIDILNSSKLGLGIEYQRGYFHPYGDGHQAGEMSDPERAYECSNTEVHNDMEKTSLILGPSVELYTPFGGTSSELGVDLDYFNMKLNEIWSRW